MKILLASPRGFCAGVNMAIESLELAIKLYGTPIYVYHEIVHNKYVVDRFRADHEAARPRHQQGQQRARLGLETMNGAVTADFTRRRVEVERIGPKAHRRLQLRRFGPNPDEHLN